MTTKKKAIIALSAVGVLAVGVIVALVAVIAAFTANTTGNFTVTYTAINVKATVTAGYYVNEAEGTDVSAGLSPSDINFTTIQTTDNLDAMVFDGSEEGETTTKAFKNVGEVNIEEPRGDQYSAIYLHYTIRNDSTTNNMTMQITETFSNIEGVEVNMPDPMDNYFTIQLPSTPVTIAPQETYDLYIRVLFKLEDSVQFDASINFVLSSVE